MKRSFIYSVILHFLFLFIFLLGGSPQKKENRPEPVAVSLELLPPPLKTDNTLISQSPKILESTSTVLGENEPSGAIVNNEELIVKEQPSDHVPVPEPAAELPPQPEAVESPKEATHEETTQEVTEATEVAAVEEAPEATAAPEAIEVEEVTAVEEQLTSEAPSETVPAEEAEAKVELQPEVKAEEPVASDLVAEQDAKAADIVANEQIEDKASLEQTSVEQPVEVRNLDESPAAPLSLSAKDLLSENIENAAKQTPVEESVAAENSTSQNAVEATQEVESKPEETPAAAINDAPVEVKEDTPEEVKELDNGEFIIDSNASKEAIKEAIEDEVKDQSLVDAEIEDIPTPSARPENKLAELSEVKDKVKDSDTKIKQDDKALLEQKDENKEDIKVVEHDEARSAEQAPKEEKAQSTEEKKAETVVAEEKAEVAEAPEVEGLEEAPTPTARPADKAEEVVEAKDSELKTSDTKLDEVKPSDIKPSDIKSSEAEENAAVKSEPKDEVEQTKKTAPALDKPSDESIKAAAKNAADALKNKREPELKKEKEQKEKKKKDEPIKDELEDLIKGAKKQSDEERRRRIHDMELNSLKFCLEDKWKISGGGTHQNVVVIFDLLVNKDGTIEGEPKITIKGQHRGYENLKSTALQAILLCSPFHLSKDNYDLWEKIQIQFYPVVF